jgi:hypothetical protein
VAHARWQLARVHQIVMDVGVLDRVAALAPGLRIRILDAIHLAKAQVLGGDLRAWSLTTSGRQPLRQRSVWVWLPRADKRGQLRPARHPSGALPVQLPRPVHRSYPTRHGAPLLPTVMSR